MATNIWDMIGTDPYGIATPAQQAQIRQGSLADAGLAMLLAAQPRVGQPRTGLAEGLARGLLTGRESYQAGLQNLATTAAAQQKMQQAKIESALNAQKLQQAIYDMETQRGLATLNETPTAPAAEAAAEGAAAPAAIGGAPAPASTTGGFNVSGQIGQLQRQYDYLMRRGAVDKANEILPRIIELQKLGKPEKTPEKIAIAQMLADPNVSDNVKNELRSILAKSGTNIQISTGGQATGEFAKTLGEAEAKRFAGVVEAAKSAPDLIAQANRLESIISNPNIILGPGADMRLAIASGLNALGADNNETLTNTQAAISSLADATLTNIKASGLGTGQGFTDKDLKFLERARSGNISFTKERLQDLVRIQRIAANNLVNKFNRELAGMPAETRATLAPAGIAPTYMTSPMTPPLPAATEAIPTPSATPSAASSGFKILSIRPGSAP